jgi:hypothetical protein
MWAVWWMVGGGVMADMAEGVIVATWMLLAMLAPAGLLWATMRAYDLIADHRDRQRRRKVRRAMRAAEIDELVGWARKAS